MWPQMYKKYSNAQTYLEISRYFNSSNAQHTNARSLIRSICKQYEPPNTQNHEKLMRSVFDVYTKHPQERSPKLVNDLLKLCVKLKYFSKGLSMWNDIHTLSTRYNQNIRDETILYPLLLTCCVHSNPVHVHYCIQILKWMKHSDYKLRNSDLNAYHKDIQILIKRCGRNARTLAEIHSLINDNDMYIKTSLIHQYGKCQNALALKHAFNVFDSIRPSDRNSVTLNAMMTAYMDNYKYKDVLQLYTTQQGLHDNTSHVMALKACTKSKSMNIGLNIHQQQTHNTDIYFKTALINFYGVHGKVNECINIFDWIVNHNSCSSVALNVMMKAYIDNHYHRNALDLYDDHATLINERSIVMALKACSHVKDFAKGQNIIETINTKQYHNVQLKNTLIDYYGHSGAIESAVSIYNSMTNHQKDIVTQNAMCGAYLRNHQSVDALSIFDGINDLQKDAISYILALDACIQLNDYDKGKHIHSCVMDQSIHSLHSIKLIGALIGMYGHFGDFNMMETIFNSLTDAQKNSECVGIMMKAYIHNQLPQKALRMHEQFSALNNDITNVLAIKACIHQGDFERGKSIHAEISNRNDNTALHNVLIEFYGHFGDIIKAEKVFKSMNKQQKDMITVNCMMNAYFNCAKYWKCMQLFKAVQGMNVDAICYSIALKSCVQSTAYHFGLHIDETLKKEENKWIRNHLSVIITLIDLYGKCGMLDDVQCILQEVKVNETEKYLNEIGIWNAALKAFGRNGDFKKVKQTIRIMQKETFVRADRKTYLIWMNACNHCGDLDEAYNLWQYEICDMDIKYDCFIVTALVDCFVRNGKLNEAKQFIVEYENYTNSPYEAMWTSLLNGCKQCKDNHMAQQVFHDIAARFSH
eukprot:150862_1